MSRADQHIDRRTLIRSGTAVAAALAAGTAVNVAALAVTKAAPIAGHVDPMFAVIKAHHDAYAVWEAFLKRDDDESDEACEADEAEHDAMKALLRLPATTTGGLICALGYLEHHELGVGEITEDLSSFLVSIACAVERIVGPVEARVIRS